MKRFQWALKSRSPRRRRFSSHQICNEALEARVLLSASTPLASLDSAVASEFESREQFGNYLIERALERYDGWFDQPAWFYGGPVYAMADGGISLRNATTTASLNTPAFSETNTQVNGVDEGDIIETDGSYLYILNGQNLLIVQAVPAGEMVETARIHLEGNPIAEYLDGDRLTVISSQFSYKYGGRVLDRLGFGFGGYGSSQTTITTYDITDRTDPALIEQTTLDGSYVDSRAFGGQVHVLTSNDVSLPQPEIDGTTTIAVPVYFPIDFEYDSRVNVTVQSEEVSNDAATSEDRFADPVDYSFIPETEQIQVPKYESRESYLARVRDQISDLIDDTLPDYISASAGGLAVAGQISEVEAITRIRDTNSDQLLSVVSINTRDPIPGLTSSSSVFANYTNGVYANYEHLYVFSPVWGAAQTQTRILEFAWANGERQIELLATGVIDGTLLNQFSADEFEGHLRIATTTFSYADGRFTQANNLVVLEDQNGTLTQVGAVTGFADGEQIRSVRFDGERAFVVTFRQVDPLFVFDLSNPEAPTITGELHVPGFSSYLQVIDADHLLAIGRSTDEFATKITLYDVSDPSHPTEIDEDILPSWTWSIAEWDHHAVGYFGSKNIVAIPVSGYDWETRESRNESVLFHFDTTVTGEDALQLEGSVSDDSFILRNAYIGNVLYTISYGSVIASSLDDPGIVIDKLEFTREPISLYFDAAPVFTETDDGASDWEYINPPDSAEEADDLLALAAKNVLNGQIRVALLQSDGLITVTVADGKVVAECEGHDSETIDLGPTESLAIDGTDAADRISLDFGSSQHGNLTEIIVSAGDGNDFVTVTELARSLHGLVSINGNEGHDRIDVSSSVSSGVRISGGPGRDTLIGGRGADFLHGGSSSDLIDGGSGNDILYGGGGNDSVYGQTGNDTIQGGGDNDYINSGNGQDVVDGGLGNDVIRGGRGNDLLRGGDGNDFLRGDDGNDTLPGGNGHDRLAGGDGRDALAGGVGNDILQGESGNDTLLGGSGDDILRGGLNADICLGEDGDDDVDGEESTSDTVAGGSGTNLVRGRRSEINEMFVLHADWLALI